MRGTVACIVLVAFLAAGCIETGSGEEAGPDDTEDVVVLLGALLIVGIVVIALNASGIGKPAPPPQTPAGRPANAPPAWVNVDADEPAAPPAPPKPRARAPAKSSKPRRRTP